MICIHHPLIRGENTLSIEEPLFVASRSKDFGLIPLEKQVIALIVAGYTSEESTQRLGISDHVLQQHLLNIFNKLKVSNRLELVLFALYHRLIDAVQIPPPAQRSAPRSKIQTSLPGI
jgi:DNA-binding CsgD family transcriptional regulator